MGNRQEKEREQQVVKTNEQTSSELINVEPIQSSTQRAMWYFNCGNSSDSSWLPFTDAENEFLEESYCKHKRQVSLDKYDIDLERGVRIDKQNPSEQIPIQRCFRPPSNEVTALRPERFYAPQKLVKPFDNTKSNNLHLVNEWKKLNRNISINDQLEQAAQGISQEGFALGEKIESEQIAQELRSMKDKSREEIDKCVIRLYTRECFLYRLINTTLRSNDESKVNTLGAFCQLLFHCDCSPTLSQCGYAGELYRGAQLDQQTIEYYKQAIGQIKTWDAFSSTSKNRDKADKFGNVLFIINHSETSKYRFSGMNISSLSCFPEEEEVLVRASRNFIVEKVVQDDTTGKHYIHLTLC